MDEVGLELGFKGHVEFQRMKQKEERGHSRLRERL